MATYAGWRIAGSNFRFFDRELKWGEVGCALSHVGVWRRVDAQPPTRRWWPAPTEAAAIVLEDDVDFVPGFAELLRAALDEVRRRSSKPRFPVGTLSRASAYTSGSTS